MTKKQPQETTDSDISSSAEQQTTDTQNIDTDERVKERLDIIEEKRSELEKERNDLKERLARALAESENLRKRTERDKQDALRYGSGNLARDLINSLDNLERALEAIPSSLREQHKEVEALSVGLDMSLREFQTILERHHITHINALGELFSHEHHQAVGEQPHPSINAGRVAQVLQPGYKLHDRLLRPAMVMISKGPEQDQAKDKKAKESKNIDIKA